MVIQLKSISANAATRVIIKMLRSKLTLIFLALLLTGCGTFTGGDYVLISKGQADGIQGILTGGVGYCKLTVKGDSVTLQDVNAKQLENLCNAVPN